MVECVAVCGAVCCSVLQCIIKKVHTASLMIDDIGVMQCVAVCCSVLLIYDCYWSVVMHVCIHVCVYILVSCDTYKYSCVRVYI